MADSRAAYPQMVRRKRMQGRLLLMILVALMASGFLLAEDRNAGDFWRGLPESPPMTSTHLNP
jgi:phosphonate transport system permease protein